jgi:hypothetical protein
VPGIHNILCTDISQHKQHSDFDKVNQQFDDLLALGGQQLDQNVNTKVTLGTECVSAANENSPDEQRSSNFFCPVNGRIEQVASENVAVNQNGTQTQGNAGNNRIQVQYSFFQSLHKHLDSKDILKNYLPETGKGAYKTGTRQFNEDYPKNRVVHVE